MGKEGEFEKQIEKRKKKIKERVIVWLKNPYHLALIAILIFSFVVNIYYFSQTTQQPLWWDEAEYMQIAKYMAFGNPTQINPARPVFFPFLASLLFRIGLGEISIKFILVTFPAWLVVLFTYILVKEIYNKKIALIASLIMSVSWINLFYSMRFMTDPLSFLFGILALICFWKGYVHKKNKKLIYFVGFFIALSFLIRLTGIALYPGIILLFLLITDRFKFLKSKELWITILIAFLVITPFLLWSYSYHGTPFAFSSGYGGRGMADSSAGGASFGWPLMRFVYDYSEFVFFIFFLVGLLTLFNMFLSFDLILKGEKKYKNDLFMFLLIIFVLFFFMYFTITAESRYLMPMSLAIFAFSAKGILLIYNLVKKHTKKFFAIFVLLIIIFSGIYFQLNHTSKLIDMKKNSYGEIKQAALWIKENSIPSDKIITTSIYQTIYYAERETRPFNPKKNPLDRTIRGDRTDLENYIETEKPKFIIVSIFEEVPNWGMEYIQENQHRLEAVQVYAQEQQPILIIYEIKYP